MWEINLDYLQKDETIEYLDRPSMLSCIFAYIWAGWMVIGIIALPLVGIEKGETSMIVYMVMLYMLMALPAIYVILKRSSTRYAITNKGLLTRVGIITNSIKTVSFKHITSIEAKETITGKTFHYAHLPTDTSGSGQAIELQWKYVKAAHKAKKPIESYIGEN